MIEIATAVLVAVHLAVAVWHGSAHTALAIALPPEKNAFVFIVILIAPLVAASLLWTRHVLVGLWMISWSRLTTSAICHTEARTLSRRSLSAPPPLQCWNWPRHSVAHPIWGRSCELRQRRMARGRHKPISASSHSLLLALFVSALLPRAALAQLTTGTSAAGLFYETSGEGEAVVLIHAFSLDRRMWAPQIASLEGRFRVIRYDLRGHGKSEGPSAPYAPYEDLRSVLDAVGVSRATLIGLSAGAEVATDFALAYPNRVARLILAAPGLGGYVPPTPLTWVQPVFQAAAAGDPERAAQLWADTPIMALRSDLSAATTITDLVMSNARLWSYRTNPAQPLTPRAINRLSEIKSPALVIVGDQDLPHIKEVARLLVDGIAGAKLVTVPRAGHIVNLDAREAFNQAVEAFLISR